ncbi:MAG TPA: type II toxin-antitoxin system Phd/YefM family antitoxin [Allocoleopsis sp.]
MNNISVDTFEKNLKDCVKKVIDNHNPLKVNNENGEDFIVISAEDWSAIEETIYLNSIPGYIDSINEAINSDRQEWINAKDLGL